MIRKEPRAPAVVGLVDLLAPDTDEPRQRWAADVGVHQPDLWRPGIHREAPCDDWQRGGRSSVGKWLYRILVAPILVKLIIEIRIPKIFLFCH